MDVLSLQPPPRKGHLRQFLYHTLEALNSFKGIPGVFATLEAFLLFPKATGIVQNLHGGSIGQFKRHPRYLFHFRSIFAWFFLRKDEHSCPLGHLMKTANYQKNVSNLCIITIFFLYGSLSVYRTSGSTNSPTDCTCSLESGRNLTG